MYEIRKIKDERKILMNPISIGTAAPDFNVKDNKKQDISLSAYKGKKCFFPGIL